MMINDCKWHFLRPNFCLILVWSDLWHWVRVLNNWSLFFASFNLSFLPSWPGFQMHQAMSLWSVVEKDTTASWGRSSFHLACTDFYLVDIEMISLFFHALFIFFDVVFALQIMRQLRFYLELSHWSCLNSNL